MLCLSQRKVMVSVSYGTMCGSAQSTVCSRLNTDNYASAVNEQRNE
jgi:hypothetical protein